MSIELTIQSLLIYQTMGLYLLAVAVSLLGHKKAVWLIYTLGFGVSIVSVVYRGLSVGHFPLQNLFEVFLFLGMLIYPLTLFCRKFLKIGGELFDIILGIIVLFPAAFVFSSKIQNLPPALQCPLFVPHVGVYMLAYVIMAKAACQAFVGLIAKSPGDYEIAAYKLVCLGFPILTTGLVLGSLWAQLAWANYWGWDPKEMWSLATWFVYLGYFHYGYTAGVKYTKAGSVWVILGFVFIIITLLWVNLSHLFAGLHNYAF